MHILVLTETGYGKRVANTEFRPKHRGGQGVRLISLEGAKSGRVAAVELVDESDQELLLISREGQVVRTDVQSINRYGSSARGVIVMRLNEGDTVAGIAVFREGLAQQRDVGENGAEGPDEDGPGSDGAAQA
jgi:DNA gyrase subunit A